LRDAIGVAGYECSQLPGLSFDVGGWIWRARSTSATGTQRILVKSERAEDAVKGAAAKP